MTAHPLNGTPRTVPVFGDWQRIAAPQPDPRAETDRAEAAAVLAKANELHAKARDDAERIRNTARTDAQRIRDEAEAATTRRTQRDASLDTWAARAVIAGTVGLTASGEYSLARMVGFDPAVAWLLPFVIDMYVIQAFRRHRDIPAAIGLTIAANVIYHLAAARGFGLTLKGSPEWWLVAIVASVASIILWRIHRMIAPPRESHKRPVETPPGESPERVTVERVESAPEAPDESRVEVSPRPALTAAESPRESKRHARPRSESKPRESRARKAAPAGDIARETAALIALMRERGGADAVSLPDAERITGRSQATAARRLSTAREQYARDTAETRKES